MTGTKRDLILYRLDRAKETPGDAEILAEKQRRNSAINRLYYSVYYAVSALLLNNNISPTTHNGVKTQFSIHYIKTGVFPTEMGRIYSQLFTWRQKGDYADLFDFNEEIVLPYFEPVDQLISEVEMNINSTFDQRF